MKNWKIKSNLDVNLAIAEFQDLVKILDKTPFAVPAPLRVLKGSIAFTAQGSVNPKQGTVPVQFHTKLKSAQQSLLIDNTGVFSFTKIDRKTHMDLKMDALLTDIELTLPHIDLKGIPKVIPDSRITTKMATASRDAIFSYEIHVHTADKPIQIVTNLASAPLPIHVDVNLDSKGPPLGHIKVDAFPVDVFHRKVLVEKFDLDLEPKKMPISGTVKVTYPQYTVFVSMKGTADQPVFQFASEPALAQADIISVLLFGKTSDDLDADQSDSVGSTRAAVSERTMDLASLYLLSATPIQSVGYDPTTGTLSTTVTIGEGTSLNVAGGQGSLQTVGVRKRLGKNFSITTEVTSGGLDQSGSLAGTNNQNSQKALAALLEWRHRY
jgi:autotransporter translocation and assembly factor TamB